MKIERNRRSPAVRGFIWGILALCAILGRPLTAASTKECGTEIANLSTLENLLSSPALASRDDSQLVLRKVFERLKTLPARAAATRPIAKAKDAEDHWKDANVSFDVIKAIVSNKTCYETKVNFLMCVAALNGLLSFDESDENITVLPKDRAAIQPFVSKTMLSLDNLDIVVLNTLEVSDRESRLKLAKAMRATIQDTWLRAYGNGSAKIDFEKALDFLRNAYVKPERESYMAATAFNHALLEADPHSRIQPTTQVEAAMSADEGDSFVGVGIQISLENEQITIVRTIEGGSAEAAGMKAGDVLTAVDGEDVKGKSTNKVIEKIMGEENTEVTLTVKRGPLTLDLKMKRAAVAMKNVTTQLYETEHGRIGYIGAEVVHAGKCGPAGGGSAAEARTPARRRRDRTRSTQ